MIGYLKNQYYWFRNFQKIERYFKKITETKILLFGHPKSGNTWVRFLIYNYHCLLLDPNKQSTLSYNELNTLQKNVMDRGHTFSIPDNFPCIYRTHKIYKKSYDLFDYRIFVHRNPLDTLISS